jgi:hypothetical protein
LPKLVSHLSILVSILSKTSPKKKLVFGLIDGRLVLGMKKSKKKHKLSNELQKKIGALFYALVKKQS